MCSVLNVFAVAMILVSGSVPSVVQHLVPMTSTKYISHKNLCLCKHLMFVLYLDKKVLTTNKKSITLDHKASGKPYH